MMDPDGGSSRSSPLLGLGGLGGLPSGGGIGGLSPYLNVDPAYLQSQAPEFIFNQDQKRSRMEHSFTAIGSSVLVGGLAGGAHGLYDGIRQTAMADMRGRLRRTQILNHTLKSGGIASNSLGSIAVIYSSLHWMLSFAHEEDNEAKSCAAGLLTGLLYKSTSGPRKSAMGAAFGLVSAAAWSFLLKKDERLSDYI